MENHKCPACSGDRDIKRSTMAAYDAQWSSHDDAAASERRKRLAPIADPLISMVTPLSGKVVVDLGMGTGSLAFRAMELSQPARMVGVDFSTPGLRVARAVSRHSKFKDTDVELIKGDLEKLPLTRRSADVVISQATINLIPDKAAVFSEISRIAKSGARVAISDAFRTSRGREDGSWEQCIGGAITVTEFSTHALNAGLIILGQSDLTQTVRQLVSSKRWDWPEFIEHNMDYRVFMMMRS
ncbi:MAG TPA: methyltransferase domain-containing protein [Thermoplasmata archaeon]|nr:methyltransferase domain-containing protein [Thermoplasmata archaeon]